MTELPATAASMPRINEPAAETRASEGYDTVDWYFSTRKL